VVFAGRFPVEDPGARVITEALPRAILPVEPSHWVIVDPVAFPYDAMGERHWDTPVSVILPTDLGGDGLIAVLGGPLLSRLTPFDTVVSPPWLWKQVRQAYALAETQWWPPRSHTGLVVRDLVAAAERAEMLAGLLTGRQTPDDSARLLSKWDVRSRRPKGRYQAEVVMLQPMMRRVLATVPPGRSRAIIEFSDDVHGFVSVVGRAAAETLVARGEPAVEAQAAMAYPDFAVGSPEAAGSLPLRAEHADLAVGLIEQPDVTEVGFLGAVWAGLRVGGSMVVVLRAGAGTWTLDRLTRLVLDAASGHAVLTEVGGARDPGSGRASSALFAFTKIGAPRTW
jgi:hypothetical protein